MIPHMLSGKYSVSVQPNVHQCVHERPSEAAISRKSKPEQLLEICSCQNLLFFPLQFTVHIFRDVS